MKILAVDDDPIILELLENVLRVVGFTNLTMCESAHQALEAVEQNSVPFDCCLFDIQMPEMDGIQLASAIRKFPQYAATPIVMITAMSDRSYIDKAFIAGASDYITKPFEIGEVHARLRQIQDRVEERKQNTDRNPIPVTRHATATVTQADFDTRIALSGIDGFIEYLALENYLLQVSRMSLFGMRAFGVVVPDMERTFQTSSLYEYQAAVSDFAEAISDSLKSRSYFAAHAGNGEFVCVLTDGEAFDEADFESQLCDTVREMDLHFCDGRPMTLMPVVGRPISMHLKSARGTANVLTQALAAAEEVASMPRARKVISSAGPLRMLFGH
ncbi:response regulator [Roseovarius aestuarii]|nr:response regulator [Roseovarius aestuarii]